MWTCSVRVPTIFLGTRDSLTDSQQSIEGVILQLLSASLCVQGQYPDEIRCLVSRPNNCPVANSNRPLKRSPSALPSRLVSRISSKLSHSSETLSFVFAENLNPFSSNFLSKTRNLEIPNSGYLKFSRCNPNSSKI